MLSIMKCSSSYSYSVWKNSEHPCNFQNKSVSSPFNWVCRYILFLAKQKRRGGPFLRVSTLCDYSQEHLVIIKNENVCPFVKFEIILLLLCCLLDPLKGKYCKAWNSLKIFWIDSRTCQKYRILLSAK